MENHKNLVFIDDSGDPGFKLGSGSSEFFVISAIIFNDFLEAEKTAVAIKTLRRDLGFPDSVEFKFNKLKKNNRVAFLASATPFNFKIRSIVFDKKQIKSPELKNNKNTFYSYAIKTLLQYSNNSIINSSIKLDGGGDRLFKKSFVAYLRKTLNTDNRKIINNFKFVDSKSNVLIQLADMIAGSIRRSYDTEKEDQNIYKNIIKNHIEDEWKFK